MSNKIFFKNKHNHNFIFSSDIFKEPYGKVNILEPPKILDKPNDKVTIREYINIHQVMEDDNTFMLLTESSFTESELLIIRDALYSHMNLDSTGKSFLVREKIDKMLFTGNYLPDDESKIINK